VNMALILDVRSPAFLSKAQELNAFLLTSRLADRCAELWLFYDDEKPQLLPQIACPVTCIRWLPLQ